MLLVSVIYNTYNYKSAQWFKKESISMEKRYHIGSLGTRLDSGSNRAIS